MKPAWVDANVKLGHGPLGALTPQKYISEGDTPSFLHLINNGLAAHLDYTLGGWGGRSAFDDPAFPNHITDKTLTDDGNPNKMYWRWVPAAQNDFAARMDWCVKEFKDANHAPVAKVKGALVRDVKPGETVKLAATATDPDGNQLTCKWWQYADADCAGASVAIANSASLDNASFVAPNEPGKQVHIILEVTDNGTPPLTGYQRVICNIKSTTDGKAKRLRVIMSSDFPPFPVTNSDPDDVQSMVRFLLYANEFDIEGLIASAGTYGMVAEKKNILAVLDKYDQVDENLRKHDPRYPTADALRAVTFEGKGNNNGIMIQWGCGKQPYTDIIGAGKDSEASNAIIAAADKPDPRPIYIGVWGGPREVAQAIWKVKNTRCEAELKAFNSKLRVFLIYYQDATHQWLMDEFPDLFIIESRKTYQGMFRSDSREWAEENIINNHGPLGAIYPPKAAGGPGVTEGDSPTFLYLVSANRGINDPEDPTQPSWGGQYVRKGSTKHYVDGPGGSTISRWKSDFQAEFKQRADWMLP